MFGLGLAVGTTGSLGLFPELVVLASFVTACLPEVAFDEFLSSFFFFTTVVVSVETTLGFLSGCPVSSGAEGVDTFTSTVGAAAGSSLSPLWLMNQ